jgi:hypothetical protein
MKESREIENENSENEFENAGTGTLFPANEYSQFSLYLEIVRSR